MQANVNAIVDYFKSGIKDASQPGRLGVELEHIVVGEGAVPVSYSEDHGVLWLLQQLKSDYPETLHSASGNLIGLAAPDRTVTIEPAAQLELSSGPYEHIGLIRPDFEAFERKVTELLAPYGKRLYLVGYHPTAKVDDLELIPKQRYCYMDAHFAKIGPWGRRMMRGTASAQISIDYFSVEDCLRKLRLTCALAPVFALICDNTPWFEGAPSPHHLMRTEVWRKCDPARCGIVPGVFDEGFTLEDYAEYVLNTPAIFKPNETGGHSDTDATFGELAGDETMDLASVEHALSLMFNDVRLKQYIEIRAADAMPIPFVVSYAGLVKGLFYSAENLDQLDELLAGVTASDVEQAKTDLMAQGYGATVYGKPVADLVKQLFDWAQAGLARSERSLMGPLQQLAQQGKTLAMLEAGRR